MTPCRNYFPDPDGRCSSCREPVEDHATNGTPGDLATVAQRVYELLTHYGHHCTVQNLLPDLRAALLPVLLAERETLLRDHFEDGGRTVSGAAPACKDCVRAVALRRDLERMGWTP